MSLSPGHPKVVPMSLPPGHPKVVPMSLSPGHPKVVPMSLPPVKCNYITYSPCFLQFLKSHCTGQFKTSSIIVLKTNFH